MGGGNDSGELAGWEVVVKIFLCGKGKAAEEILMWLYHKSVKVAVWSHPGAELLALAEQCSFWRSYQSVNDTDWPFLPDMVVSVGYLHILSGRTLRGLRGKAINCHYSLLPRHRGRSPVPWAILDGDERTGVTWHWIDTGIDTGRVLLRLPTSIRQDDTQASLFSRLHTLAAASFETALDMAANGDSGTPQTGAGSYHRPGPPYGGKIDPSWPDDQVERFIRAMTYPPLPYARLGDVEIKTMGDYRQLRG